MSFTHKPSHNFVEVNFTPQTGVAVGTSRRSLKSFPPFGDNTTLTAIPTRKDKAHSLPMPKGRGIPRRFDERDMMSVELLHNVVERHQLVDWIVIVDPNPMPLSVLSG